MYKYEVWLFVNDHLRKLIAETSDYEAAKVVIYSRRKNGEKRVMYIQTVEV